MINAFNFEFNLLTLFWLEYNFVYAVRDGEENIKMIEVFPSDKIVATLVPHTLLEQM